jgi:phosphoserine aminotransferase
MSICAHAEAALRSLLAVPAHFKILFMQGGGLAENAIVPMNLSALRAQPGQRGQTDFVLTGSWSQKSYLEAQRYSDTHLAASAQVSGFTDIPAPESWQLRPGASYVHICSNETIHGVEFHALPDLKSMGSDAALVVDFSSQVASRPMDWGRVGLAFGGAQKNLGPAGLTVVVVREDLLGHALAICPSAFNYETVAANGSMYNTPPTYAIYMAGLVFDWLVRQGGVAAIETQNIAKAQALYQAIDSSGLYFNPVAAHCRSRMNVPFFLRNEALNDAFLSGASAAGLLQLKGHKSVGGMRASLYNAMPLAGVQALVDYMQAFERSHA